MTTPVLYHRGQNDITPSEGRDVIGIDWLNVTGATPTWAENARHLLASISDGTPEVRGGRHNYKTRLAWPSGVNLYLEHASSGGLVEITGGAAGILGGARLHHLLRQLLQGGRCTRIDLCRDLHFAEPSTLLRDALSSSRAGEHCHVRQYKVFHEGEHAHNEVLTGLYLGSTQSPRFVRLYDKGVESATAPPCRWLRWEAQLREDHANEAAMMIAEVDEWGPIAASLAMSVVDFRRVTGSPHIDRRPRVRWFESLCQGLDRIRPRVAPTTSTLDGFLRFAERSVLRTVIAASREAGTDPVYTLARLIEGVEPTEATCKNPVVYLLADHVRDLTRRHTS